MISMILGSSTTFPARGVTGKEMKIAAAKISVRPSEGMTEVGWGEFRHAEP